MDVEKYDLPIFFYIIIIISYTLFVITRIIDVYSESFGNIACLKFDNIACLLILTSFLTRILLLFFKFMGSLLTASPRKFLLRGSTYSMHYLNRSGNWNEMNTTLDTNENRYILGNTESVLKIYLYSLVTFMFRNRSKSRRTLQDYK